VPKIYNIVFDREAAKYFGKLPKEKQKRLAAGISKLPEGDTRLLKGYRDLYRLRLGSFRVIYAIRNTELSIIILKIGSRGDIYKD
jgi:mRNA interferase RelE/StbE